MKYKRLTKETVGSFGYNLKDLEHKPKEFKEFNDYDAFLAYKMAVKRLGELEDKIERGELVEAPKGAVVLTPEEREEEMRLCNEERKQLEHRAEVAERALEYAVSEYRCDECPNIECNAEIRGSLECIELICTEYKKQAENELKEEEE